ncbi:MFS general substrate transporter [Penicillium soppii]|uniref:MFS general substrate transporter n=1 Tax=Penicillium soppii TaxID=69789 RepID=UPI00254771C0|nr:MFS general substrate transporter [Penicillium soppii]KAJ5855584.1 MFS general substrate transporter [Penicillium soppii]
MSLIAIAVTVISQIFMIVRWANGIQGLEVFYCLPWAIGCGLFFSPQFLALTICSPKEQIASATAVYYLSQQVGHVSGTSTSTALLQQIFRFRLDISLDNIPVTQRNMLIKNILKDYKFSTTLPPALQALVSSSHIEAYRLILGMSSYCR